MVTLPRTALRAGLLFGSLELLIVLVRRGSWFLSAVEAGRYAMLALSTAVLVSLVGLTLATLLLRALVAGDLALPERARRIGLIAFGLVAPCGSVCALMLSTGRRVRDLPGRVALCIAIGLAAGLASRVVVIALLRAQQRRSSALSAALALAVVCAGALGLDAAVLPRLYPAFHVALEALAITSALAASVLWNGPAAPPHWRRGDGVLVGVAASVAVASLASLARSPNARFVIVENAPVSGRMLRLVPTPRRGRQEPRSPGATPASNRVALHHGSAPRSIDFESRDILLITIDALRADELAAYGGHGVTPNLDELASKSAVFRHAYTPTPHTSYALASLLTGKFIKPLIALAETSGDHATLPELLRSFGYRTAAFYPPAIFFVDGERFAPLARKQFGFEYVKAMFSPAADRVSQLQEYFRVVAPGHPVFVWVHLFEPHEPYDPLPEFARGTSPKERYDGEVAAADAGAQALVAAFLRDRPNGVVVLTADHGEEFGDHGGSYHGTTLFEEQARIPLLWYAPGVIAARQIDAPVELVDIAPTLLAALGIPREVRMRGDDLGALLAGQPDSRALRAFSSTDVLRMWSDGRRKLICGDDTCRLFDLQTDPRERRDVAEDQPDETSRLQAELDSFLATIPRVEALAMEGGGAWPAALAQARLGDRRAVAGLIGLLADGRPYIKAAAARALGELEAGAQATGVLAFLRRYDADPLVQSESAMAGLRLGDAAASADVEALLEQESLFSAPDMRRRAALALAGQGNPRGRDVLVSAALDPALEEALRVAALDALMVVGDREAGTRLLPLLADVRLRPRVAVAIGALRPSGAIAALRAALFAERYPDARRAEVQALLALGAKHEATAALLRYLGTQSGVPDGLLLLERSGALGTNSRIGARASASDPRLKGRWDCGTIGCRSDGPVRIALAARGPIQFVTRVVTADATSALRIGRDRYLLSAGESELTASLVCPAHCEVELEPYGSTQIAAFAAIQARADVPAPLPE